MSCIDVLVCDLAGARFAVPCDQVEEILPAVEVAPLPHAPEVVEGVLTLRGAILPVVDLRRRFGLPAPPMRLADHLLVTRREPRRAAHVDRALEIRSLEISLVHGAPELVAGVTHLSGLAWSEGAILYLHDLGQTLAAGEVTSLAEALRRLEEPA